MRHLLAAIFVFICLPACTTGERISDIRPGMTPQQVKRILGEPDGYKKNGDIEAFTYANRLISGWSWDRADYSFLFKDGGLLEYGPGQIRQGQQPNTMVLIPLAR